jgi:hypothetical protein
MNQYYGKYRGKVANNIDPLNLGRVQVTCPAVLGDGRLSWAMPSAPYAGSGVGFFTVPPIGANVWIEFEGGDPDYPICGGCFWGDNEVPASPATPQTKVWKTDGITLTINDLPGSGSFTLEGAPPVFAVPVTLKFDASGIELSTGPAKIKLSSSGVSVNDGALEVI